MAADGDDGLGLASYLWDTHAVIETLLASRRKIGKSQPQRCSAFEYKMN
jgi:hypothetical protein